jgi:nucleoside-diphosphate-sugar epimerase
MNEIIITGSTGFVGHNLYKSFENKYNIKKLSRFQLLNFNSIELNGVYALIHLAGKAHDIKNVSNPSEYYEVNYQLTKKLFDAFIESTATVFVFMSSVKAVADEVDGVLTEELEANPKTHYGISKRNAEEYILSSIIPANKRIYILRPCMIHGPGNKGNLNLLYKLVSKNIPWPLASFQNQRSFCSIDNVIFVINELLFREDISSGVYNISDDEPISTNELIELIAHSKNKKANLLYLPVSIIKIVARCGDLFHLPLNSEKLQKLTENYQVSNKKLVVKLGKPLPVKVREGLLITIQSFNTKLIYDTLI